MTDWKHHGKEEIGFDCPVRVTGASALVGAVTVTGAVTSGGVVSATGLTYTAGPVIRSVVALGSAGTITAATDIALYTSSADSTIAPPAVVVDGRCITIKNVGLWSTSPSSGTQQGQTGISYRTNCNVYLSGMQFRVGSTTGSALSQLWGRD